MLSGGGKCLPARLLGGGELRVVAARHDRLRDVGVRRHVHLERRARRHDQHAVVLRVGRAHGSAGIARHFHRVRRPRHAGVERDVHLAAGQCIHGRRRECAGRRLRRRDVIHRLEAAGRHRHHVGERGAAVGAHRERRTAGRVHAIRGAGRPHDLAGAGQARAARVAGEGVHARPRMAAVARTPQVGVLALAVALHEREDGRLAAEVRVHEARLRERAVAIGERDVDAGIAERDDVRASVAAEVGERCAGAGRRASRRPRSRNRRSPARAGR